MKWTVFIQCLSILVLAGCGEDLAKPPMQESNRSNLTAAGAYEVSYIPSPDPIPLNEHFSVNISVESADGTSPPEDLVIEVDAVMPAHGHGINTAPVIREIESGKFIAEGMLFHMPGEWEMTVDVVHGPVRDRATFHLTMK